MAEPDAQVAEVLGKGEMPAVPGSTVPKYLINSGVLMVHVREHWDLKLNPALKKVHPPPG